MRLVPDILTPVNLKTATELLYMVDHTILFRAEHNKRQIRNVEREAIKVVNGDKKSTLICKWDIWVVKKLFNKHIDKGAY